MITFPAGDLKIRQALPADAEFICRLWNNSEVMKFVGFPEGLDTTTQAVKKQIIYCKEPLNSLLIIENSSGEPIGQCKLGKPDENKISRTDIKLLPARQSKGYGTMVKKALVNYLFTYTDCLIVEASPNINNIASIKMQEKCGAVFIKEGIYHHNPDMKITTCPVHYCIYHIYRSDYIL